MSPDAEIDERERAALQAAFRRLQTERTDACPSDDILAAFVLGDLAGQDRVRCADHVPTCRACAADYRALLEVHAQASGQLRPRAPRRTIWIAAAIAALAVAGVLIAIRSGRREEAFRGTTSAAASVEPADGATLAHAPSAFRWPTQRGAEGYRVKLFAPSGDALWEMDAQNADRVVLPEAARSRLETGKSYFWTVEVRLPLERQRLGPYSFTIAR